MLKHIQKHLISILFIAVLFFVIHIFFSADSAEVTNPYILQIREYTQLEFLDLSSPEDRQLLRETLDVFDPQHPAAHDSLIAGIEQYLAAQMRASAQSRELSQGISSEKFFSIMTMLLKFALIYLFILLITYYAVETFAVYRFIRSRQPGSFFVALLRGGEKILTARRWQEKGLLSLKLAGKVGRGILKIIVMFTLFAPAYVIAYSFKTSFDTNSVLLMILLAVISNGLLITYTQKYYTFLVSESRKGYVQTAIVKNLRNSYRFDDPDGISISTIFKLQKKFPGHVFDQIYENVRFQYLGTLKEQASFLITGLIIIEMALNIQGHLCYELMQNILYKNIPVVLIIIMGIFLVVKLTEIIIDEITLLQRRKTENLQL